MNTEAQHRGPAEPWYELFITPQFRRWLYGVFAAIMAIAAGWTGWHNIALEQWLELAESILMLGSSAAFILAGSKVNDDDKPTH